MIEDLLARLKSLSATIRRSTAVNVNRQSVKQEAIELARFYFESCHKEASTLLRNPDVLSEFDEGWQSLVRLAHGNNPRASYSRLLKSLIGTATEVNVLRNSLPGLTPSEATETDSNSDRLLIGTMSQLVPSAAESYKQGISDLDSSMSRYSYRGTACEFRECLRDVLDKLAPDEGVIGQSWYRQEKDVSGPTMKQKVRFILASRGKNEAQRKPAENAVKLIESLAPDIARATYTRASLSTHVASSREEVIQMKKYLDAVLHELLALGEI